MPGFFISWNTFIIKRIDLLSLSLLLNFCKWIFNHHAILNYIFDKVYRASGCCVAPEFA